ncbi:MAG: IS66 family insertion sequence element accessory protein TnpB [Ruminococcus sp.]|uniref:IS66 family insertion sequence element accessory protein TnpA n=1 Tax=Ruminococcus sp. TaxID=41978 RepID=UPI0025E29AE5|nr:IS66 family insertion sequence element accessory protein TnpB [Ruminococcus sp.]MBR6995357.1 IS66 family insertion sequence element accessory protein TnpB [Ruminococcus sp.]
MPTIREVKNELRHREWAEQIQECQSSGMTVTAWCRENGISQHTYYSRLNVVRKELLKRAELPLQQIVPLSVSQSVTCTTAMLKTQCIASGAEPEKSEPQKVIVHKDGGEVEMPPDISEELLLTLLRGLKEC